MENLIQDALTFYEDCPFDDDVTVVGCQITQSFPEKT